MVCIVHCSTRLSSTDEQRRRSREDLDQPSSNKTNDNDGGAEKKTSINRRATPPLTHTDSAPSQQENHFKLFGGGAGGSIERSDRIVLSSISVPFDWRSTERLISLLVDYLGSIPERRDETGLLDFNRPDERMNSTRREDDQSFIENEKVSLKIHRDPTTATTMKKRTETRKKENKKSRMAVLMSIGEDHMKWLHPGFRRLLRSPIGINRSLRLRIRARLIRSTLPRCAPFRCSHCQFATNNLPQMTNHICTQRASNHHHQSDNEQRLVDLVHRNRCKDSLAVLERARRPQRFNLPDYSTSIISMDNSFSVPSLRALAYANLSPVNRSHASDAATWTVFQDSKAKFRAYPNSVRKFAKSTLCMSCRQLFLTYQLFDDHLEEPSPCAQTLPEPCVVVLRSDGNVPAEYDHGRRFSTCELTADSQLTCTACNRSQFDSLVHFHTHLIHCANARFIRSSSSLLSSSSSPSSSSSSSSSSSIVSAVEQEDE